MVVILSTSSSVKGESVEGKDLSESEKVNNVLTTIFENKVSDTDNVRLLNQQWSSY